MANEKSLYMFNLVGLLVLLLISNNNPYFIDRNFNNFVNITNINYTNITNINNATTSLPIANITSGTAQAGTYTFPSLAWNSLVSSNGTNITGVVAIDSALFGGQKTFFFYNTSVALQPMLNGITIPISNVTNLISSFNCTGSNKLSNVTITSSGITGICTTDETGGGGGLPSQAQFTYLNVTTRLNVTGDFRANISNATFPSSSCSGTDKATGIGIDGRVVCGTDQTGSGGSASPLLAHNSTKTLISLSSGTAETNTSIVFWLTAHKNYTIFCVLNHRSAAATTGLAVKIASAQPLQDIDMIFDTWSSDTAKLLVNQNTTALAVGTGASTTGSVSYFNGRIWAGTTNHNITLAVRSEVAALSALRAGSHCELWNGD